MILAKFLTIQEYPAQEGDTLEVKFDSLYGKERKIIIPIEETMIINKLALIQFLKSDGHPQLDRVYALPIGSIEDENRISKISTNGNDFTDEQITNYMESV